MFSICDLCDQLKRHLFVGRCHGLIFAWRCGWSLGRAAREFQMGGSACLTERLALNLST